MLPQPSNSLNIDGNPHLWTAGFMVRSLAFGVPVWFGLETRIFDWVSEPQKRPAASDR